MDLLGTGGTGLAPSSQARSTKYFLWLRTAFGTALAKYEYRRILIINNINKVQLSLPGTKRSMSQLTAFTESCLSPQVLNRYESLLVSSVF